MITNALTGAEAQALTQCNERALSRRLEIIHGGMDEALDAIKIGNAVLSVIGHVDDDACIDNVARIAKDQSEFVGYAIDTITHSLEDISEIVDELRSVEDTAQ